MKNYTTQTAALKATTIDTRLLDAKQIDTKKLFINGTQFVPSPNEALFVMIVDDTGFAFCSKKLDQSGDFQFTQINNFEKGSETEGVLQNGVYVVIQLEDDFVKCIGGNSLNDADDTWLYNIPLAKFEIQTTNGYEQCILDNFITANTTGQYIWVIKICEEDDNLFELYGGMSEQFGSFVFAVKIPYYIPENDTSSSTYSLRKTNLFDNLREKIEQMRQQNLDNPTE